ncbi:MAG: ABC transporter ATP-binding protein [Angelakisella sp.]
MAARNKFDVDEDLQRSFNFSMLKRSFVYVRRESKRFLIAISLQIISILLALCEPVLTAKMLDVSIPNGDIKGLVLNVALLVACIGLNITLVTIFSKIINVVGQNIIYEIRRDLYEHMQKLSFTYFDSRPHGKILVRIINYVNSVSNILSNGLIQSFLQLINLLFITVFMFAMDARLSLVILSGLPFALATILILRPMQRRAWQAHSNKSSNMNAYLNESIVCMRITQLFTREKYNTDIYEDLSKGAKQTWYQAQFSSGAVGPIIDFISKAVTAAMILLGAFYFQPMVSFGVLMAMMQYCSRFWGPINQLAGIYNNFINNIAYLERIFEMIDEPVEVQDLPDAGVLGEIQGEVEFKNVTFEYEKGIPILNNVSFKVHPGESIALVGPTGAGKSTIINLISRFYDVTDGQVLIDGQDISKVTLKSLRSQMGIMMQDSFIFSDTIMANIRYGKLDADRQQIQAAAHTVCADDFIEQMPEKYETPLPERGSRLSQGQKQLVSFARTLTAEPKILILDEATSSIDTQTERQLQEGLARMLKGRTSFIVAHRLSTIRTCDRIMYIQGGKIVECGSHDELMAQHGLYYDLCSSQR